MTLLLTTALLLIANSRVTAQSAYFSKWPAGTSPQEIGKRVSENFVARKLEYTEAKREYVIYPEVCAWYGSLTVAKLTKDIDLRTRLIQKFDPILFDHRIGEDVAGDGVDVFLGLLAGCACIERDLEVFALAHAGDAAIAEARERGLDGLALGVEDGGFQRDVDASFHGYKTIVVGYHSV
jgi:hypothetical protein